MKSKNLKHIKYLILALPALILIGSSTINAQNATDSAELPSEKVINKIKERLDKDTPDLLGVNDQQDYYYGYFGELKEAAEGKLTITANYNDMEIIITPETGITQTVSGVKTGLAIDELTDLNGEYLLAIGRKEEDGFRALRISFFTKPSPPPERTVIFGMVTEIDNTKITIDCEGEKQSLITNQKTILTLNDGSRLTSEDILINDNIVAICNKDDEQKNALKIMVIPGKDSPFSLQNQINAAESAEATASTETP